MSNGYRVVVASNTMEAAGRIIAGHQSGETPYWEAGYRELLDKMVG
ncbi:MAG: hypothetical protein R2744_07755 [Bacteroidales bacterium]